MTDPIIPMDSVKDFVLMPRYESDETGIKYIPVKTDRDGNQYEGEALMLSSLFDIVADAIDEDGNFYRIIEFTDTARNRRREIIAGGDIGTFAGWKQLKDMGIIVKSGRAKQERLSDYIQAHNRNALPVYGLVSKTGWSGKHYILPNGDIIQAPNADAGTSTNAAGIIYRNADKRTDAESYSEKGTLEAWRNQIARYAENNSRLCLALGTAFAAPLLQASNTQGGGFHLLSDSSVGKTTAMRAALSIWGHADEPQSWNTTANALENTCSRHNDGLLILDEIGQASNPKQIANMVYAISNGRSKSANRKDGTSRAVKTWRVMALSSGEAKPEEVLEKAKGAWAAGNEVRMTSIPAAAPNGYGIFDTLHGFKNGAELSDHIRQAAAEQHGTAGRAFIRLIQTITNDEIKTAVKDTKARFIDTLPKDADGQPRRIAERFAFAAAALELAAGITGLPKGAGEAGIKQCFDEWLAENGTGNREEREINETADNFITQYGSSMRYSNWNDETVNDRHAGYRRQNGYDMELWTAPNVFNDEIAKRYGKKRTCEALYKTGRLKRNDSSNSYQHQRGIKGAFQGSRYYVLVTRIVIPD